MKTFTFDQARSAAASGGVLSANLRPVGSKFALEFETRSGTAMLITSVTKEVRKFGNLIKAFEIVRDLGIEGGRYSVAQWHPDEQELDKATRPDRSAALKLTHKAAAYDKWFRAQVQESLDDPRPSIPNDEVKKHFAAKRKKIQQGIKAST